MVVNQSDKQNGCDSMIDEMRDVKIDDDERPVTRGSHRSDKSDGREKDVLTPSEQGICYQDKLNAIREFLQDQSERMNSFGGTSDNSSSSLCKSSSDIPSSERESSSNSSSSNDFGSSDNVFGQKDGSSRTQNKCTSSYDNQETHTTRDSGNAIGESEKNVTTDSLSADSLERIANIVEYYMSDENLSRDMFLLKHVIKHREGFVSLKLLSNYKKVKRICKDWQHVKLALNNSSALEINPEGTKVRRKSSLPSELEFNTRPFRSILAFDIPLEKAFMDKLAEIFSQFGDINSLQIYKPGGRVSPDIQMIARKTPTIMNSVCAVIEYEKVHHARQALKSTIFTNQMPIKTMSLQHPSKHDNKYPGMYFIENESSYFSASELDEPFSPFGCRSPRYAFSVLSSPCTSPYPVRPCSWNHQSPELSYRTGSCKWKLGSSSSPSQSSSDDCKPFRPRNFDRKPSIPLRSSPRRQFRKNCCIIPPQAPHSYQPHQDWSDNSDWMPVCGVGLNPWTRGLPQGPYMGFSSPSSSCPNTPMASPLLNRRTARVKKTSLQENILRMPMGPNGSKGFQMGRKLTVKF